MAKTEITHCIRNLYCEACKLCFQELKLCATHQCFSGCRTSGEKFTLEFYEKRLGMTIKDYKYTLQRKVFKNFTTEDGLQANNVNSIMEDRKGKM